MEGRPWCFDQHLLVLNELSGNEQPAKVPLTLSPFWVCIYHLPFNCRADEDIRPITAALGSVLCIEPDGLGLNNYRRVKVLLDINQPLRRIQKVKGKDGSVLSIEFKYERLPFFCFLCGIIGHGEKDCPNTDDDPQNCNFGLGLWLKASPRKGRSRYLEEEAQVMANRKLSFVSKVSNTPSGSLPHEWMGVVITMSVRWGRILKVLVKLRWTCMRRRKVGRSLWVQVNTSA